MTPIDVIERMQIGSRPVHRLGATGLDGLLPVPWVFAWTQTRHMLPGLVRRRRRARRPPSPSAVWRRLQQAYANWFFLRNLIDDIETMLARVDLEIAQAYDGAGAGSRCADSSRDIRAEYALACEHVLRSRKRRRCWIRSRRCSARSACAIPTWIP